MFHISFIIKHEIDAKHCSANHLKANQNGSKPSQGKTCLCARHHNTYSRINVVAQKYRVKYNFEGESQNLHWWLFVDLATCI